MQKDVLKDIGLTHNEIEVYISLLRSGSSRVSIIASKSGLHRQAVYDALDRLVEKGLASFTIVRSAKHFQAVHPEKILSYLQQKEEKFRAILPQLLAFIESPAEDTYVEVYKGKQAYKTVYRDIIRGMEWMKGEILISGGDERKCVQDDKSAIAQHLRHLREMGCHEKVLLCEGDTHVLKGPQTAYRWMRKSAFSPTATHVYGHKIAIIINGNPSHAIIIRSKPLAEAWRKQFRVLWEHARPLPKELQRRQQEVPDDSDDDPLVNLAKKKTVRQK